jgi:hypothetical protein
MGGRCPPSDPGLLPGCGNIRASNLSARGVILISAKILTWCVLGRLPGDDPAGAEIPYRKLRGSRLRKELWGWVGNHNVDPEGGLLYPPMKAGLGSAFRIGSEAGHYRGRKISQ